MQLAVVNELTLKGDNTEAADIARKLLVSFVKTLDTMRNYLALKQLARNQWYWPKSVAMHGLFLSMRRTTPSH